MLLTKQQLRAHLMTSDDPGWHAISHLKIEPSGRVIATNGHLAVFVTPKGRQDLDESEFPLIPGLVGDDPESPTYVLRDTAVIVEKMIGKRDAHARLLVNERVTIGVTDGLTPQLVTVEPAVIDKYPNVDSLVPDGQGHTVLLSADYLALITKYAKAFNVKGIRLVLSGPEQPVQFSWDDDYHDVTVILMPMRDVEAQNAKQHAVNAETVAETAEPDAA